MYLLPKTKRTMLPTSLKHSSYYASTTSVKSRIQMMYNANGAKNDKVSQTNNTRSRSKAVMDIEKLE